MARTIHVETYNPAWPQKYARESKKIAEIFAGQLVSIHHIGSTAIPGIKAKPVIDIMVVVNEIDAVEEFNPSMVQLGYTPCGENGIPGRRYFRKDTDGVRSHHVHVYGRGHKAIQTQLNFRDYLHTHPEQAQAYSQLKEKLAIKFRLDPLGYNEAKTDFIVEINQMAAEWRDQESFEHK